MSVSERDVFVEPFRDLLFRVVYIDLPEDATIDALESSFAELLRVHRPAAFIFEPLVQGAGGMRMYKAEHLDRLIAVCKQHDVLCIADEVMTGFGRTGKLFAIDRLQQKPDFICLSKGLTGGYLPLGVTAFTREIASEFLSGDASKTFYHGHSFTANPLSCTAALASLDLLETEEVTVQREKIHAAHHRFREKVSAHPLVKDARVSGAIFAMDIALPQDGYFYLHPVRSVLYPFFIEQGIVLRPLGNVLYLIPPYCITEAQLEKVYRALEKGLDYLQDKQE
jgi:adenosylmethionine-8-amino-7-oxononanoate aminotransferase